MRYYPAFLDLRGKPCLVVGGGAVAERKVLSLLGSGAGLTIVSPTLTPALRELARQNAVTHAARAFEQRDAAGCFLAVAATNDPSVNEAVASACRAHGALVNVVTDPDAGSFIVPSVVERGDLLIAISTCGGSPALARRVRLDLEGTYGPEYGVFLEKMAALRRRLVSDVRDESVRRRVFEALAESDVLSLLKEGLAGEADRRIAEIVRSVAGLG